MANPRRDIRTTRQALGRKFDKPKPTRAQLGDGAGNLWPDYANDPNRQYCRIGGRVEQVYNVIAPPILNLWVVVGYDLHEPDVFQVVKVLGKQVGGTAVPTVGYAPSSRYTWGGEDPVYISLRQFLPLRPSVNNGMTLSIANGLVKTSGGWRYIAASTTDLTSYIPADPDTAAFVLFTIKDSDGSLVVTDGADVTPISDLVPTALLDNIPTAPAGTAKTVCAVRVYRTIDNYPQTILKESTTNTDLVDLRLWDASGSGSSGISGVTWFNVRDYGASGDGSTDDTTAVGAAVTALNAAGAGTLYFPAGTYKTSGGFTISVPALVLGEGSGDGLLANSVSKVTCTSATAVLFTLSASGTSFRDIALENTAGSTPSAGAGIYVPTGAGIRNFYEHLAVRGFYINVKIEAGGEQRFVACWFISPVKYGVKFKNVDGPDWGGLYMWGTAFYSETYNADSGIFIEGGGGISIVGCAFNSWGGPTYQFVTPIDVNVASGVATGHFEVISTGIENFSGNGIRVQTSSSTWWQWNFVGNEISKFSNTTGNSIWMKAANLGEIKDVIIDNLIARTAGSTPDVIYLEKVNQAIIGNVLMENGYTNILAQSGCTNVRMGTQIAIGTYADNSVPRIDGTTGEILQGSLMTVDDNGKPNIPVGQTYDINGSPHTHASSGVTRSGATTDGHLAVWNGSSADSIKDGGIPLTFNDSEGDPADVTTGSAADGTSTYAARRDHIHHIASSGGAGELLMQDGVTAPPVPIETEAQDDWCYQG